MSCSTSNLVYPRLQKTRRYGAKVKTGCRTCKIRRVKCDEKKPACTRCTSTGRKCDGYSQDPNFSTQALVHSQSSSLWNTVSTLSGLGDSVIYLEFYHRCASPTLASNFDHEFWSRTVLQMAQTESSVRHAVIALSYLVRTEPGNLKHARSCSTADSRKTLLLHYNKAVRCLVDRMSQPSHTLEVGLVTCLLFICIEFFRGDYHFAFTHLYNGLKMITEWQKKPRDTSQNYSSSPSSSDAIAERVVNPRITAENLVPMFIRVMGTGLLYTATFEPFSCDLCPPPQKLHYQAFTNVLDAQSAIYDLRNATVALISVLTRKLHSGTQPTTEDLQCRAHLLTCHASWFQSMQVLERERKLSSDDSVVASTLKVSHYSTYVALVGATDLQQTSFDAHISSFKALNRHAKIVLDSMDLPASCPSATSTSSDSPFSSNDGQTSIFPSRSSKQIAAHFTFKISLIPPLYFAATRCRCPATRRDSISLLARNPPREALWDAEQHAIVARRFIEMEESEVDGGTGWPVQGTRLMNAIIHGDMDDSGGFWVSFASVAWVLGGRAPQDPNRRRGDRIAVREDSEWDEWFVM